MLDFLHGIWRWIKPPRPNDTESEHYQWRIGISLMAVLNTCLLVLHIGMAFGVGPLNEYGFASRAEVDDWRVRDLTSKIVTIHKQMCESDNPALRQLLKQQLIEMQQEYQQRTHQPFPPLSCDERG